MKKYKYYGFEFFAGSQKITEAFEAKGGYCYSLDKIQLSGVRKLDFCVDFLEFDYSVFSKSHIQFLYFGFPCNTFSKASGGLHWSKNSILTLEALQAYIMFLKMVDIINYFSDAVFYIENPAGAICSKKFFKEWYLSNHYYCYTLSQKNFGFPTQKQTNIITNSQNLMLCPLTYRRNGIFQKNKLDNLSLRNRQAYTVHFANFIVNNFYA